MNASELEARREDLEQELSKLTKQIKDAKQKGDTEAVEIASDTYEALKSK